MASSAKGPALLQALALSLGVGGYGWHCRGSGMARVIDLSTSRHCLSQLVTVTQTGRLLESRGVTQFPRGQGFVLKRVTFYLILPGGHYFCARRVRKFPIFRNQNCKSCGFFRLCGGATCGNSTQTSGICSRQVAHVRDLQTDLEKMLAACGIPTPMWEFCRAL